MAFESHEKNSLSYPIINFKIDLLHLGEKVDFVLPGFLGFSSYSRDFCDSHRTPRISGFSLYSGSMIVLFPRFVFLFLEVRIISSSLY